MDSRREFLKKAAMLSGGAGMAGLFPESVLKAMAINPEPNSTYLDAEHVVILMQENRSFDHCYGKLQGVRGFNDPRAIDLPNKNKVWLQTDTKGDTYAPFRLDIKGTKATWMHDLPHSRESQVDAYNGGKYDKWLSSKKSTRKEYSDMPLTLGHYDREDIPFYYALADAFTVCDQNFCSSMTPTHPNRYYLWSGTIREKPSIDSLAVVRNSYFSYNKPVKWKTFPERLEEAGVPWAFYQNEISAVMQFNPKQGSWLGNFGCNPLERHAQYNVKFSKEYVRFIKLESEKIRKQLAESDPTLTASTSEEKDKLAKSNEGKRAMLEKYETEIAHYTEENFKKLSVIEQGIHKRAFVTNRNDPDYMKLSSITYNDGTEKRTVDVPKSDIFYQFRKDVNEGKLPTVSYLTAPQNFSDHPSAPWYGAWFVSEALDILTKNPEVWKKTIFILCYDENDGYYDHIPPFSIPNPLKPNTGKVSEGIDLEAEYVTLEQDMTQVPKANAREGAIGLGFRVPLVVASPWSRGGKVNSQVFDHTSILQFLEEFASHKAKKEVKETNISEWRRTVCGNISTVFQPYDPSTYKKPTPVDRDEIVTTIHKAQFKAAPANFKALNNDEISAINKNPYASASLPKQEPGTRKSCAIPYELHADGKLGANKQTFEITFEAGNKVFGKQSAGSPFIVYTINAYQNEPMKVWNYAVRAGDKITDSWNLEDFEGGRYHLRVYGPNGFFREFAGSAQDAHVQIGCHYVLDKKGKPTGDVLVEVQNHESAAQTVNIIDVSYGQKPVEMKVPASGSQRATISLGKSNSWYDFHVKTGRENAVTRFAGHVETGKESTTDPLMARA
ncbi:phospholipase C, phosphocholine-specific [Dyadobacter sp. CY107]|uniref:phosphocholine-specific phospholipase C n=1 Tax=Dyadobacter fanqingshengii TaxID=2906443 RepID=UPI001F318AC6|nr:phospholipase C, phosphocholine-specific [Dyadobacter fanqingshengii]MCF2506314.1 phospholipase C, phosphocholine-specific [Dyadobacter fanqingshengii]